MSQALKDMRVSKEKMQEGEKGTGKHFRREVLHKPECPRGKEWNAFEKPGGVQSHQSAG